MLTIYIIYKVHDSDMWHRRLHIYVVYIVHIIIVSSVTTKSRNPRAHCTCVLRVVLAEGYLHIIPEFLPIILALFSNSQMYLLCSKLCQHNISMPNHHKSWSSPELGNTIMTVLSQAMSPLAEIMNIIIAFFWYTSLFKLLSLSIAFSLFLLFSCFVPLYDIVYTSVLLSSYPLQPSCYFSYQIHAYPLPPLHQKEPTTRCRTFCMQLVTDYILYM